MKTLVIFLGILFALLQYQLWFSSGGVVEAYQLKQNMNKLQQANEDMKNRNAILAADIKDLKTGNEAIEEQARTQLGMVKQGEVYYQIVN